MRPADSQAGGTGGGAHAAGSGAADAPAGARPARCLAALCHKAAAKHWVRSTSKHPAERCWLQTLTAKCLLRVLGSEAHWSARHAQLFNKSWSTASARGIHHLVHMNTSVHTHTHVIICTCSTHQAHLKMRAGWTRRGWVSGQTAPRPRCRSTTRRCCASTASWTPAKQQVGCF